MDPEITLSALIAPIILILIYLFAKKLDKKHQLEHPEDRGYKWGYSQGITIIVLNLSMLVFSLFFFYLNPEITSEFVSADIIGLALSLAVSIFFLFTAYGVCQRRRGSFIILTIFAFNPFIWVINYFYIKRRPYLAKK